MTHSLDAAAAIVRLDDAVNAAFTALRQLSLVPDAARDAILAQVGDTILAIGYESDGTPLPADTDDDTGGGVHAR